MVTVHEILSLEDPGARLFARLTEAQLRGVGATAGAAGGAAGAAAAAPKGAAAPGLFIAESPNVILRGLENGYEPVAALCERDQVPWLTDVLNRPAPHMIAETSNHPDQPAASNPPAPPADRKIPIYTADTQLLRHMTGFALTRGVMCAFRRRELHSAEDICCRSGRPATRIAVLDGIVDSTNIGAIFRSAAALGFDAVLLTRTCCDPLNRRVLRVSMGAVLQVPWTWLDFSRPGSGTVSRPAGSSSSVPEGSPSRSSDPRLTSLSTCLHHMGFKTVAMALREGARALDDPQIAHEARLAVVFGNEGYGLSETDIDEADYVVCIPMSHGVDSLNVAHTASIAFWQLRQR